jgi:hypothetical protein
MDLATRKPEAATALGISRRRLMTFLTLGLGFASGLAAARPALACYCPCSKCNCCGFEGSEENCSNCGHKYSEHVGQTCGHRGDDRARLDSVRPPAGL